MANPRDVVRFDGIGALNVTYDSAFVYDATQPHGHASAGPKDGAALTLTADDTVGLSAAGGFVLGKFVRLEADGKAVVQVRGYAPFSSDGAVTRGEAVVGGATAGTIRAAASATAAEVAHARGFIQNVADVDNVWVFLG